VDTPLRRYFATLDQSGEGAQLLRHIGLFIHKAGIANELSPREIALEILSEVVVEALRAEARFDGTRSPTPWLLGIAANLVRRRREKLFALRMREKVASDLATPEDLTEEQLFDRLAAHAQAGPEEEVLATMGLDELLAELAPAERQIVEMNVLHEMKAAEVAGALGITPGNARVRLHRALIKLRTICVGREAGRKEKQRDE
jgi:RNA polymerase sigma-70 factor (ECF subfamily)